VESFKELSLPEFLAQTLRQMNFVKPMPVQAQAIPLALQGKDVIASAQTGTGKTAAFGIPLLAFLEKNKDKTALVLTPTRELATQVLGVLRQLTGSHPLGGSALLIGGANMGAQLSALARKPRLIIGTPGRVIDHLNRGSLSLGAAGFLVLDEADRMLDMGFAPQLEQIRHRLPGERQRAKARSHEIPVEPKIVIEVAFDVIQESDLHESGFSLRFPRIVRIREDKSPDEIDTLERVREIYSAMLAREGLA